MTIASEDSRTGPYNGDDVTTVFVYDFKLLDEADLVVTLTDSSGNDTVQTITTHYTVSGVGNEGGGSIAMVTAPATGEQLTITRDVAKTQPVDLQNRGSFFPETIETNFDRIVQMIQDLEEQTTRAIKLSVTESSEYAFPSPSANDLIGWDTTGTTLENKTSSAAITTTPFTLTLIDDATATEFLTTLGATAFIQTLLDDADAATARATLDAQQFDADTAKTDVAQTFTASQRGTVTTDNDLAFSLAATNNFACTVGAPGTLTFSNLTAGQSGNIDLDNTGAHAITAAAGTKISSTDLTTISAGGRFWLSYFTSNGTDVLVSITSDVTA